MRFQDSGFQQEVESGWVWCSSGNTFLNAVGEKSKVLKYVVDAEKQGKYLPGSRVPVLKPEELTDNPTDVLILPWNIAGELTDQVQKLAPSARIIAQPEMKQLA